MKNIERGIMFAFAVDLFWDIRSSPLERLVRRPGGCSIRCSPAGDGIVERLRACQQPAIEAHFTGREEHRWRRQASQLHKESL